MASSSLCARHHIQNIHGSSASTSPSTYLPAVLVGTPSVLIPTSSGHSCQSIVWILRLCIVSFSTKNFKDTLCNKCWWSHVLEVAGGGVDLLISSIWSYQTTSSRSSLSTSSPSIELSSNEEKTWPPEGYELIPASWIMLRHEWTIFCEIAYPDCTSTPHLASSSRILGYLWKDSFSLATK